MFDLPSTTLMLTLCLQREVLFACHECAMAPNKLCVNLMLHFSHSLTNTT